MKIFITAFILLVSNFVYSAEFKVSLGGKGNLKDIIEFPNNKEMAYVWTSENTFTTNTYIYGSSECSGSGHVQDGTTIVNTYVICKGKSQDGYYYISRHTNLKDFGAGIDAYEYIDGTGPWKELIGARCNGAFLNMENDYFLWNAVCNVTDSILERIESYSSKNN